MLILKITVDEYKVDGLIIIKFKAIEILFTFHRRCPKVII